MATLLIDGHNLIGRLPDISLSEPDDEQRLLAKLESHLAGAPGEVVVVFDPGPNPPADAPPYRGGRVAAIFARPPESADDVIMRLIRADPNPRHITVVTADREILACARRHRCRIVKTDRFVQRLARRPRPHAVAPAAHPVPAGELATESYLTYWYDYFRVPDSEREA